MLVIIYFNDILVYYKSLDKHVNHLLYVTEILRNKELYVNFKKCTFCMDKVIFLGHVICEKCIKMDKRMVKKLNESV
jgi:hypothetical protein